MTSSYAVIGAEDPSDPEHFFVTCAKLVLKKYGYTELERGPDGKPLLNIEDFLDAANIEEDAYAVRHVVRLAIFSHASPTIVVIGLGKDTRKYPDEYFEFEHLMTAYKENLFAGKLDSLIQNPDGTAPSGIPHPEVYFFNCELGSSTPMMSLLKTVLGNPSKLIAPKYKYCLFPYNTKNNSNRGVIEFMSYHLTHCSPTRYTHRQELLDAFEALEYRDINGDIITGEKLKDFVPRNVNRKERNKQIYIHFGDNNSGLPSRWTTPYLIPVYYTRYIDIIRTIHVAYGLTEEQEIQAVKDAIKLEPEYQDNYPLSKWPDLTINGSQYPPSMYFPIHRKRGFESLKDYLDCFSWRCVGRDGYKVRYYGITYVYDVYFPKVWEKVTVEDYRLLYNFHPSDTTIDATIRFNTADTRIFEILS